MNILSTAFFIGFSTLFASLAAFPVGPCFNVSVAVPRQTLFVVPVSDSSTTSVPFVTGHVCVPPTIPVEMEFMDGDQLGYVICKSLSVAAQIATVISDPVSTFVSPLLVSARSTASTMS